MVVDVFHGLGYSDARLTIHKVGREVDIAAHHRFEPRQAIGECKALDRPVGGDVLNKFAGVLQGESLRAEGRNVQGYFLSLSGFRESALEQEREFDPPRFVLLTGDDVESQLVASGPVVAPEKAQDAASRLLPVDCQMVSEGAPELLAHDLGWIWLCPFGTNHEITHFALIHADGRPLAQSLADRVVTADEQVEGPLNAWEYLAPRAAISESKLDEAKSRYEQYLHAELGEITLEGLPVDEDAGVRRIALEDLYVPLRIRRADVADPPGSATDSSDESETSSEDDVRFSEYEYAEELGPVLHSEPRIAILADPGSGKSTLIKRLAIAYSSEAHRRKISDNLPRTGWLPLFIRCRTLGDDATMPLRSILSQIPVRGEFPEVKEAFEELVSSSLRTGKVLLLIDGLDEIASAKDRMGFVLQLRTFLATYPNVALVLTSRKAGFRAVAGAVSGICTWYGLDDFSDDDIRELTRSWHATLISQSEKADLEAQNLAGTIIVTDRVKRLARNPLLLTTLLLVRRWVGDLPRKRSVLYEKAIEVLLMTWNVEAHEPIERDEAIPQLAFVAHSMTVQGRQRINAHDLSRLLSAAREQMPEIFGFTRITVSQFVDRIESRSSLLVMMGHEVERGELVPVYEFRHLTFQEYLTAVALVDGYYDGHESGDDLVDQLSSHFDDPQWFEVVALATVRAGRSARAIVARMLEIVRSLPDNERSEGNLVVSLLGRSLADDVQLPPDLVRETSLEFTRIRDSGARQEKIIGEILESRYGMVFQESIEAAFMNEERDYDGLSSACSHVVWWFRGARKDPEQSLVWATAALEGEDELEAMRAALWVMNVVYRDRTDRLAVRRMTGEYASWALSLVRWCEKGKPFMAYAATWALAWIGKLAVLDMKDRPRALQALLHLWRSGVNHDARRLAAWAFCETPGVPREDRPLGEPNPALCRFAQEQLGSDRSEVREDRRPAALILAYYLGEPWTDEKLSEILAAPDESPGGRAELVARGLGVNIGVRSKSIDR